MTELEELYQAIILDHNKRPRHSGVLEGATHQAEAHNPTCGDKVQVFFKIQDERVERAQFVAASCAICQASASMMCVEIAGKAQSEVTAIFNEVHAMLQDEAHSPLDADRDLHALAAVRKFPARLKCAWLPWQAAKKAFPQRTGDAPL